MTTPQPGIGVSLDDLEMAHSAAVERGVIVAPPSFLAYYQSSWGDVRRVVLHLTGSPEVADEVTQEAMLKAWQAWDRIARFDAPELWVRRVAINLATTWHRRRRVERMALERLARPLASSPPEPEADVALWSAVRALPPRQGAAIVLRSVDDRSTADIAAVLGCSEIAVRHLLTRAAKRLRVVVPSER